MKQILSLLLVFAAVLTAQAAPLTAAQKGDVIARINAAAASLKTMTCNFTQTKTIAMLSETMVAKGRMSYSRPDRLRWEYTTPYKYLFIFNGTKVYVGSSSRADVIDTNANKLFKEVGRLMMSTVTGTALSDTRSFTSDVADGGSRWQVTLVPKKKEMKKMFSQIVLHFGKKDLMIAQIDLYDSNRQLTSISLTDIHTDRPVNESLFNIPK